MSWMERSRPTDSSFSRRLAAFSSLIAGTHPDDASRDAVAAAAAVLEAEFDAVVEALEERRQLLERL